MLQKTYVALLDAVENPLQRTGTPNMIFCVEFCMDGARPSLFWNHTDEDFGGSVARLAHRRGGMCSSAPISAAASSRDVACSSP